MIHALTVAGLVGFCCLLLPLSGWWLATRLRYDSSFRFTAACLAGVTALSVAELTVYALHLPQGVAVTLVVCSCVASLRPVRDSIRRGDFAWDALLTWAGASAILVAASLRFAVHGWENAVWDWYEHWLRSLIFLTQAPVTTEIGIYLQPARGPLFNGAAALLLQVTGSAHYWVFQVFATTLNALICLPFALFLGTIGRVSRRTALLIAAAVTVVHPWYFWENTFTWTKDLTAAFVLLGIHEYLVAYRKGSRNGMAMSLAYLAPGFLCHYLVLPYAAILGLHLLLVVPVRELPVRALVRAGLVWAVLVGAWFGFMMFHFGVKRTLGANTSVGKFYASKDARGRLIPQYRVLAANLCTDLLPGVVCRPLLPLERPVFDVSVDGTQTVESPKILPASAWRNGIYWVLGYSGLLVVLVAAAVSAKPLFYHFRTGNLQPVRGAERGEETWILIWVLAAGLVINLIPIRWFDVGGSFGENLQAWFLIFVAVVVRGLARLPRPVLAVLVLAMAAEFGSADLKNIQAQSVVLPLAHHEQARKGHVLLGSLLPKPVSSAKFHARREYYLNYELKIRGGAIYFRDVHPDSVALATMFVLSLGLVSVCGGAMAFRRPTRPPESAPPVAFVELQC